MFELDRQRPTPLSEQLADQLRFLIATGRFRAGERLPSTRELAARLDLSFHTARKAYHMLVSEGLLRATPGAGFEVVERQTPGVSDRLERAAEVMHAAVRRLVGLGLSEPEITSLVEEQLTYLDIADGRLKLVAAAPYRELAAACAGLVASVAHQDALALTLSELEAHPDADVAVVPHAYYQGAVRALPGAQVVGVSTHLGHRVLAEVSRLAATHTLGLVTRHADAIGPLLRALRTEAGFSGPALALEADAARERLADLVEQVDLVVYAAQARRRLRGLIEGRPAVPIGFSFPAAAREAIAAALRR